MRKVFSKSSLKAFSISLLFLLSSIGASVLITPASASPSAAPLAASPLSQAEANWAFPNGNQFNQDYNPQNQINSSNAQNLGLAWLFPLPTHPAALLNVAGGLSVGSAPLIINGTIYAITQFFQVFALNAANGNVIWTDVLPINANSTQGLHIGALSLHNHDGTQSYTTTLFNHTPTLWYQDPANRVWAINALNGQYEMNFTDFTFSAIQGNNPLSTYHGLGATNILVDQKTGILISSHLAETSADNGRCFYQAWNILANPPVSKWISYCTPPQPGGSLPTDPNWEITQVNSMKDAQIFYPGPAGNQGGYIPNDHGQAVVDLKKMSPAQLNNTLYNDWGYVNQSPACLAETAGSSTGSTGAGWAGSWILGSGPSAGMVFVNTNNKDPYNGDCVPGPALWSAAKLALNESTGAWIWGLQTTAHDIWDYDCSWWQALANATINGQTTQVEISTCKSGYVFVTNAVTGNLIYAWTPPQSIVARCQYCYMLDPTNKTQMNYVTANPTKQDYLANPYTTEIESESAYSPVTNLFYVAALNAPVIVHYVPLNHTTYFTSSGLQSKPPPGQTSTRGPWDNTTVFGVDLNTGQIKWTHFIPIQGYRGGISVSGNVLFLTLSYGDILMLNAQNGNQIRDFYIGGPLNVLPSIGASANGQMMVIFPIDAGLVTWGTAVPGDLVALTLQAPAGGGTTTVTSAVTSTTTVSGGTVTSTTTVGAGSTVTTTVSGKSTVTTTVGGGATATVTTTSGGVDPTLLYGVAAVAVIFIIATGFLAMRGRRKPAP